MATTGIIVDDEYYIMINGVKFTHLTSCSLTIGQETIDVTSFDSSRWKDFQSGDKEWSMDVEAFYATDAAEGGDEAAADLLAGTSHTLLLTSESSGDATFSGSAYPTSCSFSFSKGSGGTVSASYQGTGALSIGAVA